MPTANERYFDSQLRHAVGVRRFTAGQVKAILAQLEDMDAETVRRIRRRIARAVRNRRGYESAVLAELLDNVHALRNTKLRGAFNDLRGEMRDFAKAEIDFEGRLVSAAVPIEVSLASVDPRKVAAVVTSRPFQGALLREWVNGLVRQDADRLERTIKRGIIEGLGTDDIVRSVVGTRRMDYADGILATTRRNAEALVRTTVNHVSNGSRELFYEENKDFFVALRWEATLDGRTSAICRGRDGAMTPVGDSQLPAGARQLDPPSARPPAHINCRSTMVGVLDDEAEIFEGLDRQSEVGPVPQDVTYNEWLRRQPTAFQDEVLGRTKAKLFRDGGLTLDKFTDRRGNELTLDGLRRTQPEAFEEAGIS